MMPRLLHTGTDRSFSLLVNAALFGLFLLLFRPVYDTVEDAYLLYQLSGGFGAPPSSLTHYNHVLHPLLAAPLCGLFRLSTAVNWYTLLLLASQFGAGYVLLRCLLRSNGRGPALLLYLLFFLVFGVRFLERLNFSSAAISLGMAGLLRIATAKNRSRRDLVTGAALLVLGSLWRIHVLLPLLPLALPALWIGKTTQARGRAALSVGMALVAVVLLHWAQVRIYTDRLPGWPAEEAYRQQQYDLFNHRKIPRPQSPTDSFYHEARLLHYGLFVDPQTVPPARLQAFLEAGKSQTASLPPGMAGWFFINTRVYLAALLLTLLLLRRRGRTVLLATIGIALTLGTAVVVLYAKLPGYLLLSLTGFPVLLAATFELRTPAPWRVALVLGLSLWSLLLLRRTDRQLAAHTAQFRSAAEAMRAQPDRLFVVSADEFALQQYPALEAPARYPLPNYLGGEHFLLRLQAPVLQRFGLRGLPDLPSSRAAISAAPLPYLQEAIALPGLHTVALPFADTSLHFYQLVADEPHN